MESALFPGIWKDGFPTLPGILGPEYVKHLGLCVWLSGCSAEVPQSSMYQLKALVVGAHEGIS
uniref:Macaca fascicularis brain cDNA clone: QflA-17758, similar to human hypothetical gene supported by AK123125 (LOC401113), mRNA, RefSeq: XM_379249.1 n=1 Tax=Macaca fascicularis TaxID=9541 RepID=I7GI77_MACFA|nr:unnamed protein product [Macaca fascicularis]